MTLSWGARRVSGVRRSMPPTRCHEHGQEQLPLLSDFGLTAVSGQQMRGIADSLVFCSQT